jgi:protein-S-isoprenylcysteine O-methyltransferase Ste14
MAEDDRQPQKATDFSSRTTTEQAKLIGAALAGVALLLFFLQNMHDVAINFLWMDWHMDMAWALVLSAALGGGAVFFGMWFMGRRRTKG